MSIVNWILVASCGYRLRCIGKQCTQYCKFCYNSLKPLTATVVIANFPDGWLDDNLVVYH